MNIDWLMEHADIPVQYRIAREILHDTVLTSNLTDKLLMLDSVQTVLTNLRGEEARKHTMPEHGAEDIFYENAILMAANLGLNGGIPQLRDAADYYIEKLHEHDKIDSYFGQTTADTVYYRLGQHFPAIIIANLSAWAGIRDTAVTSFLTGSLEEMYNFTLLYAGDVLRYPGIYMSADECAKLKNVPAVWRNNKYFIRREFTGHYGFSYPLLYDMFGLSSLYGTDIQTDKKINAVIKYISSDLFHSTIADGYGTLAESNGRYHAMGWDPKYPGWGEENPSWTSACPDWSILGKTDKLMMRALYFALAMSHYPAAIDTPWFMTLMTYLEDFRTDHGTYIFRKEWLKESHSCAVLGYHMSLGENRRQKKWPEVESTFYMLKLKATVEETRKLPV